MTSAAANDITLGVLVGFWPLWIAWELVLLRLRAVSPDKPKTISMVARDRGWHLSSMVYAWGGLATHYWWPSEGWATVPGSIAFWVILLALFVQDLALWNQDATQWPRWLKWQRWPLLWLVAGALAGRFLFPQRGPGPWSL